MINPEWQKLGPEKDIHFAFHPDAFTPITTDDNMKRFNQALEVADSLTGFLMDTRSAEALIWMLVNMGHFQEAANLRDAVAEINHNHKRN